MKGFFANFLVILGAVLIGFGIGLVIGQASDWQESYYWLALVLSLIFGGFLTGIGLKSDGREKQNQTKESENIQ
ncbi:MAG: hypothetical protein PHO31_02400 [Candidatus Pacebacteria bacterium]|nr:hypothetical protein [Candidatus Paceibacterota bacterium]